MSYKYFIYLQSLYNICGAQNNNNNDNLCILYHIALCI